MYSMFSIAQLNQRRIIKWLSFLVILILANYLVLSLILRNYPLSPDLDTELAEYERTPLQTAMNPDEPFRNFYTQEDGYILEYFHPEGITLTSYTNHHELLWDIVLSPPLDYHIQISNEYIAIVDMLNYWGNDALYSDRHANITILDLEGNLHSKFPVYLENFENQTIHTFASSTSIIASLVIEDTIYLVEMITMEIALSNFRKIFRIHSYDIRGNFNSMVVVFDETTVFRDQHNYLDFKVSGNHYVLVLYNFDIVSQSSMHFIQIELELGDSIILRSTEETELSWTPVSFPEPIFLSEEVVIEYQYYPDQSLLEFSSSKGGQYRLKEDLNDVAWLNPYHSPSFPNYQSTVKKLYDSQYIEHVNSNMMVVVGVTGILNEWGNAVNISSYLVYIYSFPFYIGLCHIEYEIVQIKHSSGWLYVLGKYSTNDHYLFIYNINVMQNINFLRNNATHILPSIIAIIFLLENASRVIKGVLKKRAKANFTPDETNI